MKHPDYPNGFPKAKDKSLFGKHEFSPDKWIHVTPHPHGYQVRFSLGHEVTVAGDRPDTVREYLIMAELLGTNVT